MAPGTALDIDACCEAMREGFLEQPALRLTLTQAQRLWGVGIRVCERAFYELVAEGFLVRTLDDQFCRPDSIVCGWSSDRSHAAR
jgi:hypothetical protein